MSATVRSTRPKGLETVLVDEVSTTRKVIELLPDSSARHVTLDLGARPDAPAEVAVEWIAAVLEVVEVTGHSMTVTPIRISTGVPGSAVHRTAFRWSDLDAELRRVEGERVK